MEVNENKKVIYFCKPTRYIGVKIPLVKGKFKHGEIVNVNVVKMSDLKKRIIKR